MSCCCPFFKNQRRLSGQLDKLLSGKTNEHDHLSKQELTSRVRMLNSKLVQHDIVLSDVENLRYLRAQSYNVDKAHVMVMDTYKKRDKESVRVMGLHDDNEEFLAQDKSKLCVWHGRDKSERPTLIVTARQYNPAKFSKDSTIRYLIYKVEQGLLKNRGESDMEFNVIVDFTKADRSNIDLQLISTLPLIHRFYPSQLAMIIVYPVNAFFQACWYPVSLLLDEKTRSKFIFLKKDDQPKFLKVYSSNQLQARFGGNCADTDVNAEEATAVPLIDVQAFNASLSELKQNLPAYRHNQQPIGCNLRRIDDDTPPLNSDATPRRDAYATGKPELYKIRCGPNYHKKKLKKESASALYELCAADAWRTSHKLDNIAKYLDLETLPFLQTEARLGLPNILIVNILMPTYKPLAFNSKQDGEGVQLVQCYSLSEWALQASQPCVDLFSRWVHCFEGDKFRDRLKCIVQLLNQPDLKLGYMQNNLCDKYNGTPWLVRPEFRVYKGRSYVEIDIDMHEFSFFARKSGYSVLPYMEHMVIDVNLVIQAERDEEMPERMLCATRLFNVCPDGLPVLDLSKLT